MKKLLTLAILFTGSCSPNDENAQGNTLSGNEISIEINYGKIDLISEFLPGITHTQNSIDPWDEPKAAAKAKIILENSTYFQNQHIWAGERLIPGRIQQLLIPQSGTGKQWTPGFN